MQLRTAALSSAQEQTVETVETVQTKIARTAMFNPMRFMTPSFRASWTKPTCRHMGWQCSLQITDIGRDGFNLGPRQVVRRWRHDRGSVDRRTLTSFALPA